LVARPPIFPKSPLFLIGEFRYDPSKVEGPQTSPIDVDTLALEVVTSRITIEVLTNHGESLYTCVHPLEVHGKAVER